MEWPSENTLEAFDQARAQGARAIELDVRTCAGGDAIVYHDATLDRMTGSRDTRRVSDVRWEELRRVSLVGGGSVPRLSDVLAWARAAGIGVNVEMKHDVPYRPKLARTTIAAIRESGADVLLSSFDPLLLALVAGLAPAVPRALLTHESQGFWADTLQETVRPSLVQALHVERAQARPDALVRYRRRGLRMGAWTVNDLDEARALAELGVSSIITDRPGDVLRALGSSESGFP